jgi:hypothetical protein
MNLEDDSEKNTQNVNLKAVAWFVIVWSVLAIISVLGIRLVSYIFGVFFELFGAISPSSLMLNQYALGYWGALSIYAVGVLLGFLALKYPLSAGALMAGDGLIGIMFGGPISRIFGLLMILSGGICIVSVLRAVRHSGRRARQ